MNSLPDKTGIPFIMSEANVKVSFASKVKGMSVTEFSWESFRKEMSSPDDQGAQIAIVVFTLSTPIPKVTASGTVYHPTSGQRIHDFITDVVEVRCKLDLIEKFDHEFTINEDGSGSYKGDMSLDMSKSRRVWLTDTKLSMFKMNMKQDREAKSFNEILRRSSELAKS